MKKGYFIILLLSTISLCSYSQKIENQVISSGGAGAMNGINLLDWTVGETFIDYYKQGVHLHQGFHQVTTTRIQSSLNDVSFKNEIEVYPNPSSGFVTLISDIDLSDSRIRVISLNGKIVYQSQFKGASHELDVSSFTNGLYFIQLFNNKKTLTYKLIKSSN
jgi:hypothetical protein